MSERKKKGSKPLFDLRSLREIKTTVTCNLNEESDELLMDSAQKTGRTKKKEAELRLADHLRRFSSIEQVGQATERKLPD
ncbi:MULTISPECIES: TraY domain-containing protein [Yersinia]|jgi:TraY domain|uniref:TraY domain-containing protein n=1 Tax=Yersinia TaxID=629 RepID=UPI0005E5152D|nr:MULTISPECIES: TraY domain-containing protein [Yersinia]EKN3637352.1 TraY domain-containing protein [Yersinia enterocolitica]ELI8280711.1 TraY domain-containing protein [Yersinia enterocolitica]MCB5314346.1 TraY domain-containing protein [Yersinia intermedia]MCB5324761.1 TraY domain-containing protein [Yersinia intermedia]MCB5328363.1 TraY domain-containing protein [Yersinia intermedia]